MSDQAAGAPAPSGLSFPDEVVTQALVRVVDMPLGAGRMALITIDNGRDHTRPSTFGPAGLASLDAAIDAAMQVEGLAAVAVTGKPFIFAVGADLSAIGQVTDASVIREFGRLGHRVFGRLGTLGVPSFAFVNGAAMGGGTELALHCDYRTMSTGAGAMSLPEVFLGLIPGWGGSWLLPRLIGPEGALKVIVSNALQQNKQLKPTDAAALGVVDALIDSADFLAQSILWAARVVTGELVISRAEPNPMATQIATMGARALLDARLHGASPAAYKAVDLIAAAPSTPRDEAFAAEDEALVSLVMGDELRASLYAFDLVQRRAKRPAGAPDAALARAVTKVGIVGAGLMASQLALLFARRLEVPVCMVDVDQERADRGLAYVSAEIDSLTAKSKMSADRANRTRALVTAGTDQAAFADADVVIEAVFEELGVKQQVLRELEAVVSETCVLATNTSSLSVTAMSEGLAHPERVVGFHFFNPVAMMPLVEVVRTPATDPATLATAFAIGKRLRKSCVLVADAPAFVVNRLLTRFLGEIMRAVDEGADPVVADHALDGLGLPMSPLALLGLVGPAVALHVARTMQAAFPDRYHVSPTLIAMVDAGLATAYDPQSKAGPALTPQFRALLPAGTSAITAEEVKQRALDALADEVRRMLDEQVVQEVQDIDLCMILGAGWPFWLGGISPYLDRAGASERSWGGRFLPPGVASVPAS